MANTVLQRLSDINPGAARKSLFFTLVICLVLILFIQTARLFWTIITPVAPLGNWHAPMVERLSPRERTEVFSGFDPFFRNISQSPANGSVTSLSLTLFGISSNEASGAGSAIIAGADGVQQSYSIGEEILSGVSLSAVAFDHVILNNQGIRETLFIDQSVPAKIIGAGAPDQIPDRTAPLKSVAIADAIGLTPRTENGRISGLVVSAKGDLAQLERTGLRDGDIIVEMNGAAISSAADIISQIRPGARLSVLVERGAQKLPIAIIVE